MPCYRPLHGFRGPVKENGKRDIVFRAPAGTERQDVPCGSCVGCRLEQSRNWAVRCMHEAASHERNCVVTLTYDDKHYPPDGSLQLADYQKFMKRLRREYGPVRYFHCGEYGDKFSRPHYHALLFGFDFDDKVLFSIRDRNPLYTSKKLDQLWPFGYSLIGEVTFQSASYVTRYCLKKQTGKIAGEHYVDKSTGVLRAPEYTTMSRRPGIGAPWFKRFSGDVYPSDQVIINGHPWKPPRYYDNLLAKKDPDLLDELKLRRMEKIPSIEESSDARLAVKEEVKIAQLGMLKRTYEEGQ